MKEADGQWLYQSLVQLLSLQNLRNQSSSVIMLDLNLDNFECACARDTPFVLTSPTSLEACAQLDVEVSDRNGVVKRSSN